MKKEFDPIDESDIVGVHGPGVGIYSAVTLRALGEAFDDTFGTIAGTLVALTNEGFNALSYFHVAFTDDYIFTGAEDEIISMDASVSVRRVPEPLSVKPVLKLVLADEEPPLPPGWYVDSSIFDVMTVETAGGTFTIVTEHPTEKPKIGLNILATKRPVFKRGAGMKPL